MSPRLVKVIYYKNVHSFLKNYADLCYFYLLTWFTAALLVVKAIRVESMYEEQDISIFRLKIRRRKNRETRNKKKRRNDFMSSYKNKKQQII